MVFKFIDRELTIIIITMLQKNMIKDIFIGQLYLGKALYHFNNERSYQIIQSLLVRDYFLDA